MDRKRSVPREQIEKMTEEQIKMIEEKFGDKLKALIDSAVDEANDFLGIYGLHVKMQFIVEEKE